MDREDFKSNSRNIHAQGLEIWHKALLLYSELGIGKAIRAGRC